MTLTIEQQFAQKKQKDLSLSWLFHAWHTAYWRDAGYLGGYKPLKRIRYERKLEQNLS